MNPPTHMEIVRKRQGRSRFLSVAFWQGRAKRRTIDATCPGYSGWAHWSFFCDLIKRHNPKTILILGVYFGRDIAYLVSILKDYGSADAKITGVDTFSDTAGADWPKEMRNLGWKDAGFGQPPDINAAQSNIDAIGGIGIATLYRETAEGYLSKSSESFDFIYIDISHDYDTTIRTIELALLRLAPGGHLGGDDFSDDGTWGVKRAVSERFSHIELYENWIWLASPSNRRS